MNTEPKPIRGLGEIALRVKDLGAMHRFYAEIVGLEPLRRFDDSAFFKIADGYAGHTQILALFDRRKRPGYNSPEIQTSTIDHIAFEIRLADFEREKARLESLGVPVATAEHAWVHWRSLYIKDPEGNSVEWVCYDESVR